jgi:hypothetical protein
MEKQKRRSPFDHRPRGIGRHGEHVSGTPNQMAVLDGLNTYRYLNSDYLRKLIGNGTANDIIGLLSQEGYIRAVRQLPRMRGYKIVYENVRSTNNRTTSLTERLLEGRGQLPRFHQGDKQFNHQYLIAVTQFSFDIAPLEIPGLKKRTLADIKAHENYDGGEDPDHIRPDAPLFGYEYARPDGRKRYFYLHGFEADCGTESLTGLGRQTIERKVDQYRHYIAQRVYDEVYGISNLSIAFVTMSEVRARNILDIIRKTAGAFADKFLVKSVSRFTDLSAPPPPPTGHMVTEPWLTTDGTLSILEVLKHERKTT